MAPFKDWDLPAPLSSVRAKLKHHVDGDRQFVKILARVPEDGIAAVADACADPLEAGIANGDVVIAILARKRQPPIPPSITTPDALKLKAEPIADCALRHSAQGKGSRLMERHQIIEAMTSLKLYGMRASFDEIAGKGLNRREELYPLLASLIRAEVTHRQSRSITYRITGARFPMLKDLDAFVFDDTPVDEGQIRELAGGDFIEARPVPPGWLRRL